MSTLLPQDLAFADTAPWQFDFEGIVTAAPAEVWSAFTDNESWTIWFKKCRVCRATSETFDGVGATRYIDVNGLKVNERFIAWEPEQLWAFTVIDMRMPFATAMVERARFTQLAEGRTKIEYRMAVEPRRWAAPLRGLIARQATKSFDQSFRQLDRYLATRRQPGTT